MNTSQTAQITVRLTPRAGSDAVDGWHDGQLRVRVIAPAIDDRANQALTRLLARTLRVAPSRIELIAGKRSRTKRLTIHGLEQEEMERTLVKIRAYPEPFG